MGKAGSKLSASPQEKKLLPDCNELLEKLRAKSVTRISGVHDITVLNHLQRSIFLIGERHNREGSCEDDESTIQANEFVESILKNKGRQIDFFLPTIIADESLGYSQELLSIVASFRSDCVVSKGDKSVSAVLVRSYKDRITVGQGEVEGSNASKEENEPTSSSTHDNVRRAAILVVVSTALGALAVFAMRSVMKISKR